ncbi:MAG: hypothetical protein [Bacteriophage sp.]|nr:MAG: hypothetical protein [Bacteriophage sp.]UVM91516.1 MAG: hypothetical protein [Bacteriophage sp.]UVN01789.1 MAG: hypothetical protein [Bacteriophage sp.]UVX34543.1 MAG: hypothetical protein [Bacteriophage sp.]UVX36003.1 MAG: hypothetical protein [Bacteriophage sp.]
MNKIVLDTRLNNGLQICVWRDIDNAVWEVEVIDEKTPNISTIESFKEAKSVLEYLTILQKL